MFKKHMTPLRKKGQLESHTGKGASEQVLPSRHALNTLTKGDPARRTMNDYAKATPLANPRFDSPDIFGE